MLKEPDLRIFVRFVLLSTSADVTEFLSEGRAYLVPAKCLRKLQSKKMKTFDISYAF